jgi:hypothetical protein
MYEICALLRRDARVAKGLRALLDQVGLGQEEKTKVKGEVTPRGGRAKLR